MSEYIERTSEIILAANAGARAIENTERYHGAFYTRDVFADNSAEIAYLQAAKVLRDIEDAPAADVAPVVHGRWESIKNPKYPAYSHDKCSICGWWNTRNALCYEEGRRGGHSLNYCPNCGGKMDLEDENG
jgi:hypothetical protein